MPWGFVRRATGEWSVVDGRWSMVSAALDLSGLATNTTLNVERWTLSVGRSFDPAARLAAVASPAGAFAYGYCGWNGAVSAVSNSALTVAHDCDIMDRVTNTVYRNGAGAVVRSFAYAYDPDGLLTQQVVVAADGAAVAHAYAYRTLQLPCPLV